MKLREAVVAGQFYPDSAQELRTEIGSFLTPPTSEVKVHALIVPHAGYCYSGAVAGYAYAYLKPFAAKIKRVVLLGPSHRVPLHGCAISDYDLFTSPLGKIKTDTRLYKELLRLSEVNLDDSAHLWEHSLEVQLPFLQYCLNDFQIVPIVVGYCQPETVSDLLKVLKVDDPDTLVVVSSDLSHYHPYQEAQQLDNQTINKILDFDNRLAGDNACGCFAVNGLLDYAKNEHWKIKLVKKANSGDLFAGKNEVVGYASFILY
jgi:AmmeMemoRadiSam system protein B